MRLQTKERMICQLNAFFDKPDCILETTDRYMLTKMEDALSRIGSIAVGTSRFHALEPGGR